jgi:hypothetical protein
VTCHSLLEPPDAELAPFCAAAGVPAGCGWGWLVPFCDCVDRVSAALADEGLSLLNVFLPAAQIVLAPIIGVPDTFDAAAFACRVVVSRCLSRRAA